MPSGQFSVVCSQLMAWSCGGKLRVSLNTLVVQVLATLDVYLFSQLQNRMSRVSDTCSGGCHAGSVVCVQPPGSLRLLQNACAWVHTLLIPETIKDCWCHF